MQSRARAARARQKRDAASGDAAAGGSWFSGLLPPSEAEKRAKYEKTFNDLDVDGGGTLDAEELRDGLLKLGKEHLDGESARKLYQELLKRLDDANDGVRLGVCAPLASLFRVMNYTTTWSEQHNFDKTNYQYLLRGLLVHLDDPALDIQQAVYAVLEAAMVVDPPTFAAEVRAVRERHRSSRLCDRLLEQTDALGQLV